MPGQPRRFLPCAMELPIAPQIGEAGHGEGAPQPALPFRAVGRDRIVEQGCETLYAVGGAEIRAAPAIERLEQ